ncbi:hypothetical protein VSS37_18095 [Candidatus Thiothrix sp. Deng01]|uniref:Uncharacterized protein n=1 Tax=Candidatus Thiothrix phosphatis TaxID=3112415 RepID=A0ABU6D252_9GAMM|nr:hypothetical protein [Candidatus Thiothrix sp. Deng01]MEB4592896.1 hypothetical protein [Candidatus Thiothrix sp. Deng01]
MSQYPASTQSLIDEAALVSGHGFDIVFDASLPVASSVRIAGREGRDRHEIVLRLPGIENNYLIAWQAAFVLHQYKTPETERANLQPNAAYLASVKSELLAMHPGIPAAQREHFTDHVIGGVLTQLRSTPVGMLIDIHLHRSYPELHALQQESLVQQVVEHVACLQLTPEMFPRTLVRANQVMNAAQALMTATLFEMPGIFDPYRTVGMEAAAAILLEPCLHQVFDGTKDRELIDAWGGNLGIETWYRWA